MESNNATRRVGVPTVRVAGFRRLGPHAERRLSVEVPGIDPHDLCSGEAVGQEGRAS